MAKSDHTSATVLSSTGGVMRVYDAETHGKDFEKLAKEFSEQHKDSTIVLA